MALQCRRPPADRHHGQGDRGRAARAAGGGGRRRRAVGLASTAALQQTLKLAGYWDGPVDGQWSDALTAAVGAAQTDLGVPVTGTVDAATVAAFQSALAAAPRNRRRPPRTPSRSRSPRPRTDPRRRGPTRAGASRRRDTRGVPERERLAEYRAKRDPARTPEPVPARTPTRRPSRAARSSSRSTTPGRCTGTSGWSATACWSRGRCRRGCRRTRRPTTSRSTRRTTRWSTPRSRARSAPGEYGGGRSASGTTARTRR